MREFSNSNVILGGLVASVLGILGISYIYLHRDRRKYTRVGTVSRIFVHPIKSCRGLEVSQAECVALGIRSGGVIDRSFAIINAQSRIVTQRKMPSIALISPSLSEDKKCLLVDAPGMPTLTLSIEDHHIGPNHKIRMFGSTWIDGEECDPSASEWMCQYLGASGYKLIRHTQRTRGRPLTEDRVWGFIAKSGERTAYQDIGQVTILGESSLENLNSKLDRPVQVRNFRPNIVFEGAPAFHEDNWKYVRIGNDTLMRKTFRCDRCQLTTVDPDTGEFMQSGEPFKTLKTYRIASDDDPNKHRFGNTPLFGINLAIEQQGCIKLGDQVYASML